MLGLSNTVNCKRCNKILDYEEAELDASGHFRCDDCAEWRFSPFHDSNLTNSIKCQDCKGFFAYDESELNIKGDLICLNCAKKSSNRHNMPKASARSHVARKPELFGFKCATPCGKSFVKLSDYWKHLARKHPSRHPYKCKICNKIFLNSSHLIAHQKSHR